MGIIRTMIAAATALICTVSAGATRSIEFSTGETGSYFSTGLKPPFTVKVKGVDTGTTVDVSPHSRKISTSSSEETVTFKVREKGWYVIGIQKAGADRPEDIYLFVEDRKPTPDGVRIETFQGISNDGKANVTEAVQKAIDSSTGKTLIFGRGTYLCTRLQLRSGTDIYLEEGAVIKADPTGLQNSDFAAVGLIEIRNADNVRLRGYGAIDGSGRAVAAAGCRQRNIFASKSSDILLEGIISEHPARWNTHMYACNHIRIRNVKLFNDYDIRNTDGFDPDGCTDVLIDNCFAKCSDDNVAIKSTVMCGPPRDVCGITVRNCVFLTKKTALKVGTETCATLMSEIVFENNDVVESDRGMSLCVRDGAELKDITYRNNRFERNYPDRTPAYYHFYVNKRTRDSKLGSIHHVLLEDNVFEKPFPLKPKVENPFGARLEFDVKNLVLPE